MANLKNNHMTWIKHRIYDSIGEHAVSNIVNIIKVHHILVIVRTIFYN